MVRFMADASLHHGIVRGCRRREPRIDFLSAHEAELQSIPDAEVLAIAAEQRRVLVTSDLRTMPQHFSDFIASHDACPGIFLVKQRAPIGDVIDDLLLVWASSETEEWNTRIVEIPLR
jgi:hypothetical protein